MGDWETHDGAHEGLTAEDGATRAIAGDAAKSGTKTPAEMEAYLLTATVADSYDSAARCLGKFILLALRARPELHNVPTETVYDWKKNFDGTHMPPVLQRGLSDLLKDVDPEGYKAAVDGVTGFQWGWAVNAARYVLQLPPVKNPALMEL